MYEQYPDGFLRWVGMRSDSLVALIELMIGPGKRADFVVVRGEDGLTDDLVARYTERGLTRAFSFPSITEWDVLNPGQSVSVTFVLFAEP